MGARVGAVGVELLNVESGTEKGTSDGYISSSRRPLEASRVVGFFVSPITGSLGSCSCQISYWCVIALFALAAEYISYECGCRGGTQYTAVLGIVTVYY